MTRTRIALGVVVALLAGTAVSATAASYRSGKVDKNVKPGPGAFITLGGFGTNPNTGEKTHVTGKIECSALAKKASRITIKDDDDTFTADLNFFDGDCEDLDSDGNDGSWVGEIDGTCNGEDAGGDFRATDGEKDGGGGYGYGGVDGLRSTSQTATTDSIDLNIILRPKPNRRAFSALTLGCDIDAAGTFQGSIVFHD